LGASSVSDATDPLNACHVRPEFTIAVNYFNRCISDDDTLLDLDILNFTDRQLDPEPHGVKFGPHPAGFNQL
jgi:hypothetical protein